MLTYRTESHHHKYQPISPPKAEEKEENHGHQRKPSLNKVIDLYVEWMIQLVPLSNN